MKRKHEKRSLQARWFQWIPFLLLLVFGAVSCNEYPLQQLSSSPLLQNKEQVKQSQKQKVDILFVVDNSQSMSPYQIKLAENFGAFIQKLAPNTDKISYHIGVVTTDYNGKATIEKDEWKKQGRLYIAKSFRAQMGDVHYISSDSMTQKDAIALFKENVKVGVDGLNFEQHLESLKGALEASTNTALLNGHNKGFLREDALLAVIFVTNEDDYSSDNTLDENLRTDTQDFYLDKTKDPNSSNLIEQLKATGQRQKVLPLSKYINFLKQLKLKKKMVVAGIIGNPFMYKAGTTELINTGNPCQEVRDTAVCGGKDNNACFYNTQDKLQCGGCNSSDGSAKPGFRLYEIIKEFGSKDSWFPICGDNQGFQNALLTFAGLILQSFDFIELSKIPQYKESISLLIKAGDNQTKIAQAKQTGKSCNSDVDCASNGVCAEKQCYGNGWVYFPPSVDSAKGRVKLSGTAKELAAPQDGSSVEIEVFYLSSK